MSSSASSGRTARASRRSSRSAAASSGRPPAPPPCAVRRRAHSTRAAAMGYLARALPLPRLVHGGRGALAPPAPDRLARRPGRATGAARARRPRGRTPAQGRGDVEGNAAAPRDRAGAGRLARACCSSTSRRARSTRPAVASIRGLLESLRDRGIAVLLNSHLLSEVELVCDRVAILLDGRIVAAGRPGRADAAARRRAGDERRHAADRGRHAGRTCRGSSPSSSRAGEAVYGVRVLRSTLEDVYLDAVGEEP